MSKNKSIASVRAWNILRLTLLWARKGRISRKRLVMSLTELTKGLKKLRNSNESGGALVYGDRQFSFDATPTIHVKMHRPSSLRFKMPQIPCIKPHVEFDDYDFEFDEDVDRKVCYGFETRYLKDEEEEMNENSLICDEGIDLKAEQFIAKFYEQMKLQRQVSYLQYDDRV